MKALVKKLTKVMQQVNYVPKRGRNEFHKYTYATEADVAEKVREALATQNVVMIPSVEDHSIREITTKRGETAFIATVAMTFTFIDGDTGESLTLKMVGEGQDTGDKAVYKAITGAQKYALLKAFMIPTGDDPEEAREDEREEAPKPQAKHKKLGADEPATHKAIAKFHAVLAEYCPDETKRELVKETFKQKLGIKHINEATMKQISECIAFMEGRIAQRRKGDAASA